MSRPEDIPQDVMEAAQRVAYQVFESMTGTEAHEAIARAILAAKAEEREACELTALEQRCERGTPWDAACVAIAAAIRKRGEG